MESKKTIITTTGFYNTGSSAITHLLSEIEGVANNSDVYEIRLLYDPDGISDLEYHLVENPHRQNTSFAMHRFKDYIDFNSNKLLNHHYERLCEGNFKKISYDYIADLTRFYYIGASHLESYKKGKIFWFLNRCYKKFMNTVFSYNSKLFLKQTLVRPQIQYGATYDQMEFLKATKAYVGKFLSYLNKDNEKIIMVDQLLPATGAGIYCRYIPDDYELKLIIVERDPRDLYVICKKLENANAIPCNKPSDFCDWYLWTRGQSKAKKDPLCVKRVQFEDLIYEYEETRKDIIEFCGLKNLPCKNKKTIFRPELSINNTQTWYRYPELHNDIRVIEDRLKPYCYNFDKKNMKPDFVNGKMFEC